MKTRSLTGAWQFLQPGAAERWPATVPDGLHTDFLTLGSVLDPYVGVNEKRVQWVAGSDWEYRCQLAAEDNLLV